MSGAVQMLLPDSWWFVDVTSAPTTTRSVRELVERRVGRADRHAPLRAELRSSLLRLAADARGAGAVALAFSLMEWRDVPLPGSLAVYRVPRGHDEPLAELAVLADGVGSDDLLDVVATPHGTALRRVRTVGADARVDHGPLDPGPTGLPAPGAGSSPEVDLLRVDYWLDVAGLDDLLLVCFSTPLVAAADLFLDLFGAVVDSVAAPTDPTSLDPTDLDPRNLIPTDRTESSP
ncbi:hypothetical protein [Cellulomonas sp. HZM]|uniref:hypothetical protein n=1 Tax=Cellulomonas sp. HZM TaxID=1454010 RepID=UPI000493A916|nr:hypothetical protein [Cellulomonas sp. HZM]